MMEKNQKIQKDQKINNPLQFQLVLQLFTQKQMKRHCYEFFSNYNENRKTK